MREKPDHYTDRAKKEGYLARSVYKLQELDKRVGLFGSGARVLDLGAAPGSWTQYALQRIGGQGLVCAVDSEPLNAALEDDRLIRVEADILSPELEGTLEAHGPFDVVLSDAAPATSGNRTVDAARSAELAERALQLVDALAADGANAAVKVFQGGDEQRLLAEYRSRFRKAKQIKPKACRKGSIEIYLVGNGFAGEGPAADRQERSGS